MTLSTAQESIVVEFRRLVLLLLDDLLVITREFINSQASRSGIDLCLRRHRVANLRALQSDLAGKDITLSKTFKDYEPMDQMPNFLQSQEIFLHLGL